MIVLPSHSKECNNQRFLLDSLEQPFPLSNLRTSLLSFGFSSFSQARLPNLLICLEPTGSTLWSTNIAMARKSTEFWWYIPGQNVDSPWRYVSLPEGVLSFSLWGCFPKMPPMLFFSPNPKFYEGKKSSKNQTRRYQGFWMMWSFLIPSGLCLGSTPQLAHHQDDMKHLLGSQIQTHLPLLLPGLGGIDPTYDPSFQMFSHRKMIFLWDVFVSDFSGECFWGCVRFDSSCCNDIKDPMFLGCFIVNQS